MLESVRLRYAVESSHGMLRSLAVRLRSGKGIRHIVAVVGLPRSGTTLITSILGSHPAAVACFEPWNQNKDDAPGPEMSPEQLLEHFGIEYSRKTRVLVVKETSVSFQALLWLRRFLQHNSTSRQIHTAWIVRSYRHNYLSLMDTGREQWGNSGFALTPETYERYVKRARQSTAALANLCTGYPGVLFSYERLASAPEVSCRAICAGMGLRFDPQMLEYPQRMPIDHVHGDVGLATQPQPVSRGQVDAREAQWESLKAELSAGEIDAARLRLDAFWERVTDSDCISDDERPALFASLGLATRMPPHFTSSAWDLRRALHRREDFKDLVQKHRRIVEPRKIEAQARMVARQGFEWEGVWARPSELSSTEGAYREGYVYRDLNSRQRAILSELREDLRQKERRADEVSIYAPEYLSGFAGYCRENFANFHGSEYFDSPLRRKRYPGVPAEDLTALSLANESMHYVLVNDVFEHLPDIGVALREIYRILKPGGTLLSTFPFAFKEDEGLLRARLGESGEVEHLMEPEFHGDPVNKRGVLVFRIPGWHILDDCRAAGFTRPAMIFLCKPSEGILSSVIAGVFILKASK